MELRQLEAFVAVAQELHFGRAAAKLNVGQPTISDLIHRLERELGTQLFNRTTRRVTLTEAGAALLGHGLAILAEVATATASVRSLGTGEEGTVRFGFTPPAAPVLAPHLCSGFATIAPLVKVEQAQLWLPDLVRALADGSVDVAVTCGLFDESGTIATEVFASEPLLVGLRPGHRLADRTSIDLHDLTAERLGMTEPTLFPAWTASQLHALDAAGIAPQIVSLTRANLNATGWLEQSEVEWILLIGSVTAGHVQTVVRPVTPALEVSFVIQWRPSPTLSPAAARFVRHALDTPLPSGWNAPNRRRRHRR